MAQNTRNRFYVLAGILALMLLALIIYLFPIGFLTTDDDLTYHLINAQGLVQNRGLSLWETWDSMPLGRPHLYPPVVHFLIAIPVSLHLSPFATMKLMSAVSILILLTFSWIAICKIFNPKTGLMYLLLAITYFPFIKIVGVTIPASMTVLLSPFLVILVRKKQYSAATILLSLFFYTHMAFPWFIAGALFFWAICNREYFSKTLIVIFVSIGMYSPWLVHILSNIKYLRYVDPMYKITNVSNYTLNLNILILAIISIFIIWKNWKKYFIGSDLSFFLGLCISALPVAYADFPRYSNNIGLWAIIVVVAYCLSRVISFSYRQISRTKKVIIFILFAITLVYGVKMDYINKKFSINVYPGSYNGILDENSYYFAGYTNYHFSDTNLEIARIIHDSTKPDAVILNLATDINGYYYDQHVSYLPSQLFASLAERRMANLRYPELYWQASLSPLEADIIIVNRQKFSSDGNLLDYPGIDIASHFKIIAHDGVDIIVLRNLNTLKFTGPKPQVIIPLWLGWTLLGCLTLYITYIVANKSRV